MPQAVDPVLLKLSNVLGAERACATLAELKETLGLFETSSAASRLQIGNTLIKRGGLMEAIGRSIKIQALLHGARE
jgi:hypothetical protein